LLRWLLVGCVALLGACSGSSDDGDGGYGGAPNQPPPAAIVTIAVEPAAVAQGQEAVLTWSSNAAMCSAGGAWMGAQAASGTLSVSPTTLGTNTYTLTCGDATHAATSVSAALEVTAATAFTKSNLVVSDGSIPNIAQDPLLINPWGIAFSPASPIWTANNGSHKATIYDGTGIAQPLVVDLPAAPRGNADATGIVFSAIPGDFVVTDGTASAGAAFIFAGESGTISGWSPAVDGTHAITVYDDPNGAVFKGLAMANNGSENLLYATDFHNNEVVVLDRTFARVTVPGGFKDETLPEGYAPFGIQALPIEDETRIVVTYAKQDLVAANEVVGAGFGLVNVFDTDGTLVTHLVEVGGELNAPWGLALAPENFGSLGNKLLVGNFGSGVITAYDPVTGERFGTVNDATGSPIATPGLWGIAFGNGARNQPKSTLYFFAGINQEAGGLFGRIDLGATAPDVVAPTVQITAPAPGTVSGIVRVSANARDNVGVTQVEFFAGTVSVGTVTNVGAAPVAFDWNTALGVNGSVALTAQARDAAGNVTTSSAVALTVDNTVVRFSDLYAQIFAGTGAGHCANCHTGGGNTLPAALNLSSAANAYAALVNVASIQQPTLARVNAGDPATSYLINKLEGVNIGTTSRMPFGGPFLDQATIDSVKTWIAQGALNN
jgi:uncharacterized protein (TIGR03118 family)